MRIIRTAHLKSFADSKFAEGDSPYWIKRLILASVNPSKLRAPTDDATRLPGFDLEVVNAEEHMFVPTGASYWEVSADSNPKGKAEKDYQKRTEEARQAKSSEADAARSTFVFATPRSWTGKEAWVKEHLSDGVWADIRVIDGVDLVAWFESAPPVALKFASAVGLVPPEGLQTPAQAWEEWSHLTAPPTVDELVVAGRNTSEEEVIARLLGPPSTFAVRADSPREALGFVLASVRRQQANIDGERINERTIVAADEDVARGLENLGNVVVLLKRARGQVSGYLSSRGAHVVVPEGNDSTHLRGATILNRPTVEEFAAGLEKMGLSPEDSRREARVCGRSVAVLQRQKAAANVEPPAWSIGSSVRQLVPALLAGRWSNRSDADRKLLCELARVDDYDLLEASLSQYLLVSDPPLQRFGDLWVLTAPADAFELLARGLTAGDLSLFKDAFRKVFSTLDPRVDADSEEWMSQDFKGERGHSASLRAGMAETLLLIAERGENAQLVHESPQGLADETVRGIRGLNDDWRVLASLRDQYARLMEAAPSPLLEGLEQLLLEANKAGASALLTEKKDSLLGGWPLHTGILWGLETLAWETKFLPRVSLILAGLARLDPGGRTLNRPINSLREIFLWWHPGTGASVDERIAAIDLILTREPGIGWTLLTMLLDAGPSVAHNTAVPRWREFERSVDSRADVAKYVRALADRALALVGREPKQWKELLDAFSLLTPLQRERALDLLAGVADTDLPKDAKDALWEIGREFVNRQRSHPNARWTLPADLVSGIERAIGKLIPDDLVRRHKWLFDEWSPPIGIGYDSPGYELEVEKLRNQAIDEILGGPGIEGVVALGIGAKMTGFVARAAVSAVGSVEASLQLLERSLKVGESGEHLGALISAHARGIFGESWRSLFLKKCKLGGWAASVQAGLLRFWPDARDSWIAAAELGEVVESQYWQRKPFFLVDDVPDREQQIVHLIKAGRALELLHSLASAPGDVPGPTLEQVFDAAVQQMSSSTGPDEIRKSGISSYDLSAFLAKMRKATALTKEEVARREYQILPLLGWSDNGGLTLHELMAHDPEFFVQVLIDVFRPASGEPDADVDKEQATLRAQHGYRLLSGMDRVPGLSTNVDDPERFLLEWVSSVRAKAAEVDRAAVADLKIGEILAHAPNDPDGLWPHRAVRAVIESTVSEELGRGFSIGRFNMRGVVSKAVYEGGVQERGLAKEYRDWADGMRAKWSRTADLLDRMARGWEDEARREDTRARQDEARDS